MITGDVVDVDTPDLASAILDVERDEDQVERGFISPLVLEHSLADAAEAIETLPGAGVPRP